MIKKTIIGGCESRGDYDTPYMTRYTLIENKLFQVCIHVFHRSDFDCLHDHPWTFASFILQGGYIEETLAGKKRKYPGMLLFRRAHHFHRVELINNRKAVTLVIMGKRIKDWYFLTRQGALVLWKKYFIDNKC